MNSLIRDHLPATYFAEYQLLGNELIDDWVRMLETARAFDAEHPELAMPPGFDL